MKTIRLIAVSFVFAAIFAIPAFAQTTPVAPKIGFINTAAFDDDKEGITRFINAMMALEGEFKQPYNELQTMINDFQKKGGDFENLKKQAADPKSPISQQTLQTKADELQNLETMIKRKKEDTDRKLETRKAQLLTPIEADIQKAIQEFAGQKGYSVIMDAARLDRAGIILAWDEKSTANLTAEFVKFFNARPAATTATK